MVRNNWNIWMIKEYIIYWTSVLAIKTQNSPHRLWSGNKVLRLLIEIRKLCVRSNLSKTGICHFKNQRKNE